MRRLSVALTAIIIFGVLGTTWPASGSTTPPKANVVIRVEQVGGFVGPNFESARLPDVVLYSDGRVLAQHNVNNSVKEMFQGYVSASVLRAQIAAVVKTVKKPSGGWGTPAVADVPSTDVSVLQNGTRYVANVYALGFKSTNLSKEAITARTNLSKTIVALIKLAGKTTIYKALTYEVWPLWVGSQETGTGMANPAAVFCLSQSGTLVAGKDLSDPPTPPPDPSIRYCHLPDGSFIEEWAYFYRVSKTGIVWPSNIASPAGRCTSVAAKPFTTLLRNAGSKQWLLPSGAMTNLTWRPVLPHEIGCKR